MMDRAIFDTHTLMLRTEEQRERVKRYIDRLPLDQDRPLRIVIDDPMPEKSRDQEKRYHAMIGDIARQYTHCGRRWSQDDMKRILIDQFQRDTLKDPDIAPLWGSMGIFRNAPAFDGSGVVILNASSKKFSSRLASVFIEWLFALGAELKIVWSDPTERNQ